MAGRLQPPVKLGSADPYTPPKKGQMKAETHLQIGPITQYVTSLVESHDELPDPRHGITTTQAEGGEMGASPAGTLSSRSAVRRDPQHHPNRVMRVRARAPSVTLVSHHTEGRSPL